MTLTISHVTKRFGEAVALNDISLTIERGEFVCFLGPSGCGKTTLLRIIAGLELAEEGTVTLEGNDLSQVPARQRNFGVVFQSYSLFPNMTAARNVGYGLECRRRPRAEIEARSAEMLRVVALSDHAHKLPSQLSGGQQQRVALARALATNPDVLLLDEPLSALDAKVRDSLRLEIRELQRRLGITTIMVTHDQEEALTMADRIVVMDTGRIAQVGTAHELYEQPSSRFVAEFIGRMNVLPVEGGRLAGLPLGLPEAAQGATLIGVRPEDVRLHANPAPSNGAASMILPAQLRNVIYIGNLAHLVFALDGVEHELVAEMPGHAYKMIADAERIGVELPAATIKVLA